MKYSMLAEDQITWALQR